jgi:hypothetical protein
MSAITLYIKTYSQHIEQADRLLKSIFAHNKDNLPVVVSVNPNETELFNERWRGLNITIIDDREIFQVTQPMDGWRYQQVIKSNFWRVNPNPVYLCLDSDIVFIKDFYQSDFMYTDTIPYTLMHESKDMLEFVALRKPESINNIFYQNAQSILRKLINNPQSGPKWDWGPGPFIWANSVWKHFEEEYLIPNQLRFDQFMHRFEKQTGVLFSEYILYGEYLWHTELFRVVPKQPLIKSYHWKEQFVEDFNRGVRASHIRHNYLGVGIQSNWIDNQHENMVNTFLNG